MKQVIDYITGWLDKLGREEPKSATTAYILCVAGFGFINGLQYFYLGKKAKGMLFLCTFGFFGIGTVCSFFTIEDEVDAYNAFLKSKTPPPAPPSPNQSQPIIHITINNKEAGSSSVVGETSPE